MGGFPLIPATLATMAWMTSLSLDGCDFSRLTGPAVTTLTESTIYPFVEVGFNSYRVPSFYASIESWESRYSDPCVPYSYLNLSSNMRTTDQEQLSAEQGQGPYEIQEDINYFNPTEGFFWSLGAMSHTIATIIGGSAALFLWVPCLFMVYTERAWRIGGLQLILASFFHLCSLVWFFNQLCMEKGSTCHWYYGSYSCIASFTLYVLSSTLVFLKYPNPIVVKMVRDSVAEEFEMYQRRNGRPNYNRTVSDPTVATEMDNESTFDMQSDVSHTSAPFINPVNTQQRRQQQPNIHVRQRNAYGLDHQEML